jgi:phosphoglycerate dehydrogenase-like enzyme
MKAHVAVLDDFQGVATSYGDWARLADRADVTVFRDHLRDEDALAARLAPFDVVTLMRERTPLTRSLIERLPKLRLIVTTGMWNRSIDLDAAAERDIVVCGTQTSGSGTVQATFALILALLQQIPTVDRDIREGRWQTGVGDEIAGKTIGVIGLGRIGTKVAKIARAFDMDVLAWSQNLTPERAAAAGADYVEKDKLLRRADVVSIHVVLSERSRGLIGAREFALMKPTAFFVNTSRGPIADEGALLAALREGRIAGAGLDVFDIEPLPLDHPLRSQPNTVLTPHIGYVSKASYATFYSQTVDAVEAWLDGAPIRRIVTSEVADKAAADPRAARGA